MESPRVALFGVVQRSVDQKRFTRVRALLLMMNSNGNDFLTRAISNSGILMLISCYKAVKWIRSSPTDVNA